MYIWTAIDIDDQLLNQKEIAKEIEKEIGFRQSNISSLPLHISLKISADVKESQIDNVKKDLISIFNNTSNFKIDIDKIELNNNIVWIKMKENSNLRNLHETICNLFKEKYNIEPHQFDKMFIFHCTLFLDDDTSKIEKAYNMIKDMDIPATLNASCFVIGHSSSGQIGTYSVSNRISI